MKPYMFSIALVWASLVFPGRLCGETPGPAPEEVKRAAVKGLGLLEKSAAVYVGQRQCFSCHHQALPIMALTAAKMRGFEVNARELERQVRFSADFLGKNRTKYEKGQGQGGQVATAGYALWALELGGWKADATTAAVAEYLLQRDQKFDFWKVSSKRPPSEASQFTTTYLAIRGLKKFGGPDQKEKIGRRLDRARKWLLATPARDTEDRVFRLGALYLVGTDKKDIRAAALELLKTQGKDGGWSQTDKLSSDAYATGSALVMLHQAGELATAEAAYQRGLKFLVADQKPDGSWLIKSRSRPFQTYFESGFPYGKDQFISISGSAWATTALILASPK